MVENKKPSFTKTVKRMFHDFKKANPDSAVSLKEWVRKNKSAITIHSPKIDKIMNSKPNE